MTFVAVFVVIARATVGAFVTRLIGLTRGLAWWLCARVSATVAWSVSTLAVALTAVAVTAWRAAIALAFAGPFAWRLRQLTIGRNFTG